MSDSRKKSLLKAISWRLLGTISVFILSFIFTQEMIFSLKISVADFTIKLAAFYLHERIWNKYR